MPYIAAETVEQLVRLVREQSSHLACMRVELASLRADVRALAAAEATDNQAELIEAAHASCAGRVFMAAELLAAALGRDAAGIELAALVGSKSVRSIGKALQAARDRRTESGLMLRRVGDSSGGALWCVTESE